MTDKETEQELVKVIDEELKKCALGLYPRLCRIRDSKVGASVIHDDIRALVVETPMDIRSALAQYESSL